MADRRVTRSRKDSGGNITALCSGASWSPRSASEAINDIESGRHTYYVQETGARTNIHVVDGSSGKYLRSTADESSTNNLDNLPGC